MNCYLSLPFEDARVLFCEHCQQAFHTKMCVYLSQFPLVGIIKYELDVLYGLPRVKKKSE